MRSYSRSSQLSIPMSFLFFELCIIIALIPIVFSLNITLESAPAAFQNTSISLRWAQNDPVEFVLGAFIVDENEAVSEKQVVKNFTADKFVNVSFNYTSPSGNESDCILLAWPPFEPHHEYAKSERFSVTSISVMPTLSDSGSSTMSSPAMPNSTLSISSTTSGLTSSSASGIAQSTSKGISTEAVVGAVICAFVLLFLVSAALFVVLWQRRKRKLKESAPSRAFWRYLDRKGPPVSRPARETFPAYTAQGRTFQRPAVRPPTLKLPENYYLHGNL